MAEVRRWGVSHRRIEHEGCSLGEFVVPNGKYVLYADYAALESENARLKADLTNGEQMYIAMRNRAANSETVIAALDEERDALKAQVERLEIVLLQYRAKHMNEWQQFCIDGNLGGSGRCDLCSEVDSIITARAAKEQK